VEHTTAAHILLTWLIIKELLHGYDENYVMELELSRGLVRFEGRGEKLRWTMDWGIIPHKQRASTSALMKAFLRTPLSLLRLGVQFEIQQGSSRN
jgi:hypothetical protein